jgi:hypothetical protein
MDLPLYYSLTPTSTGAFRLRHSEAGGWGYYTGRPGWQLDLEQDYNYGGSTEGAFMLNRITSANDWGARWTQRKEFDNDSQVYSYLDFPSHRSLFGSMNYSRSLPNYTLSVNSRANKMADSSGSLASDAYIQTRAKPLLGGALNYMLTSRVSADSSVDNRYGTGLGLQLFGKPMPVRGLGSVSTSLVAGRRWGAYEGSTLTANAGLYHNISNSGSFGLDYTYSWGNTGYDYSSHRISANLNLSPSSKWSMYAYATKGISDRTMSAFGSLNYRLAPTWRFGVMGTYQAFGDYSYPDSEFALSKAVGKQDMSLIWSSSRQRFRFEFSALQF